MKPTPAIHRELLAHKEFLQQQIRDLEEHRVQYNAAVDAQINSARRQLNAADAHASTIESESRTLDRTEDVYRGRMQ